MRPNLRALLCLLPLTALAACAGASPRTAPVPDGAAAHVIVISIDGLRPDAIDASGASTLQRLRREGAMATNATTIFPSKTLPSHTSMLTGVGPEKHGVTWNEDRVEETGRVTVPTVFDLAHDAGRTTAAFFGKAKFRHLMGTEALDYWATAPRGLEVLFAPRMVEDVERYLKYRGPNLLFIHIPDPDIAGHAVGWMSRPYRAAVRRADAAVARIREAAVRRYGTDFVLIVTADHGGHDRTHGTDRPVDMRIPWIVWGKGVVAGPVMRPIRTFDTAATALWLLGVPIPGHFDGRAVTEAFAPPTVAPTDIAPPPPP